MPSAATGGGVTIGVLEAFVIGLGEADDGIGRRRRCWLFGRGRRRLWRGGLRVRMRKRRGD